MDTENSTTPWIKSVTASINSDQMKSRKIHSPNSTNDNSNKTTSPSSLTTVNQNSNVVALLNQMGAPKSVLINTNSNNISKFNDNDHLTTTVIPVSSIEPHHAIITNANTIDFYSLQNNPNIHSLVQHQQTQHSSMGHHIHNHSTTNNHRNIQHTSDSNDNELEDKNNSSEGNQNNSSGCISMSACKF
jgi:hypothetical protein